MSPPIYRNCTCGHLGGQHRKDGSCMRCECAKFVHPSRSYVVQSSSSLPDRQRHHRRLGSGPKE